jgi:hypothetical protein
MKPLPLKTVIGAATPLPWKIGQREPITGIRVTNELLFVHAVNILPELVEALEHVLIASEDNGDMNDIDWGLLRSVLKKATTII